MNKSVMIGGLVLGSLGFFAGMQSGWFSGQAAVDEEAAEAKRAKQVAPRFPDDLAPSAKAEPVAAAREFRRDDGPHRIAFLKPDGALHPWHQLHGEHNEDWQSERVEDTALTVVVGTHKKHLLETVQFSNGPPIDRIRWDLEISVVATRTGKVLANRTFVNLPRKTGNQEEWARRSIGQPVHYRTVFQWVRSESRQGFPHPSGPPLVVTID